MYHDILRDLHSKLRGLEVHDNLETTLPKDHNLPKS